MYLGHSFLAFAAVAAAGRYLDLERRRVLLLAGLAAGYGILPDVDTWRTLYVFLQTGPEDVFPTEQHVWQHSWVVHRALTHSVVTGGVAAAASGLLAGGLASDTRSPRLAALGGSVLAVAALLVVAARSAGVPGLVTMGLFAVGALAIGYVGYRRGATGIDIAAVAGVGLLTHPFGDFWMGRPPALLAPVVDEPPIDEMFLSSDPVLHFLGAIAIEVALLAACVHLVCRLADRPTTDLLSPLAPVGLGIVVVLGRVPHPTFAEAYQFATALFIVTIGVVLLVVRFDWRDRTTRYTGFVSGVTAFGLGLAAYAVAYVLVT